MGLKMKFAAVALVLGTPFANAETGNFYIDWADMHEFLLLRTNPVKEQKTFAAVKCIAAANLLKVAFPQENTKSSLFDRVVSKGISQIEKYYPAPLHAQNVILMIGEGWGKVYSRDKKFSPEKHASDMEVLRGYVSGCDRLLEQSPK